MGMRLTMKKRNTGKRLAIIVNKRGFRRRDRQVTFPLKHMTTTRSPLQRKVGPQRVRPIKNFRRNFIVRPDSRTGIETSRRLEIGTLNHP